jgi:hypothetical protein
MKYTGLAKDLPWYARLGDTPTQKRGRFFLIFYTFKGNYFSKTLHNRESISPIWYKNRGSHLPSSAIDLSLQ